MRSSDPFRFYGVTCLQTIYYFMNCEGDGNVVKGWVSNFKLTFMNLSNCSILTSMDVGRCWYYRKNEPGFRCWQLTSNTLHRTLDSLHLAFMLHDGYTCVLGIHKCFNDSDILTSCVSKRARETIWRFYEPWSVSLVKWQLRNLFLLISNRNTSRSLGVCSIL